MRLTPPSEERNSKVRFVFDERKAAEAAAILLQLNQGPMPYIKLIKLLYLADRRSLVETGYTITGDRMVSMDHGPVLSRVYDCNKAEPTAESFWHKHVTAPSNYEVALREPTDGMSLSDYEEDVLREVFGLYGHLDRWKLVDYMHTLPEWEDPSGSSYPIDIRVILREAGKSDEEIEYIATLIESFRTFTKIGALVG